MLEAEFEEEEVLDADPPLVPDAPAAVLAGDALAVAPTPARTGPLSVSWKGSITGMRSFAFQRLPLLSGVGEFCTHCNIVCYNGHSRGLEG